MRIFIDDLRVLRIESDEYIHQISMLDYKITWQKNENGSQYFTTHKDIDLHLSETISINNQLYPIELGIVTLSEAFDKKFRYDGPLGYEYHQNKTKFTLFSPVAKEVKVIVDGKSYEMTYEMPVWKTTVEGDLENKSYLYSIRLFDTLKEVRDPYANAATPQANIIIDFNKTYQIKKTPIKVKHYVDAVIYEGHVRDMSVTLDVEHPGTFDGLMEDNCQLGQSVLSYVKKLGMTHLQLLPIYDFELVNETQKDEKYNWGYNPSQYFVLEGWYSKNPNDPYDRINSLKKMIEKAHDLKLGINMDVVYNHVFNHKTFPYDDIVPGYFYRHDGYNQMTNGSYCGNDVETRRYMVRRLIVDSLVHFATQFQMDGFRFDLMGLLDLETMSLIEKKLKEVNSNIMLYGEGWNMETEVSSRQRSNMYNQAKFPYYAHFNDYYRNTMKGDLNTDELGFAMGGNASKKAMKSIVGSPHMFTNPNQSINYVECHDNLTFYDRMIKNHGFELPDFKVAQDFVNHMIAISQGIPFYHAGQEFYRSKKGVENSYESSDHINKILWRPYEQSVKQLRKLLKIRKRYKLYRLNRYDQNQVKIEKVDKLIIYTLEDKNYKLIHYIKNYFALEKLPLNEGKLIFPSQKAITEKNQLFIDQPGIYIIEIKK